MNIKKLQMVFAIFFVIAFVSCKKGTGPGETTTHNVSVTVAPSDGGSVSPSADESYEEAEEVEFEATANEGYVFAGWTGDIESADNPLSVTTDKDYELTANFELKNYQLTVNTEGEGTISEQVVKSKATDYDHGTVVELTATPASGWSFIEWKGDTTATDSLITITVNNAKELTAVFENPFSGGDGTESNPYKIYTLEDLQNINSMSTSPGLYFMQVNDIDATETADWNIGKGFEPLILSGFYDGKGYVISDLTINRDINNVGLFAHVSDDAEVRNVTVENVNITGGSRIGGLAGFVSQHGTIYNSSVTGNVHCTDGRCGGLVGDNYGSIENSYADVNVSSISNNVGGLVGLHWGNIEYSYAIGNVTGVNEVGGLVGRMTNNNDSYRGRIYKSYARGQVTGKDDIGGLVGNNSANIRILYSFATGKVSPSTTGSAAMGGLIGRYYPTDSTVQYCYWDTESTEQIEGAGGSGSLSSYNYGLTTSEMTGSNAQTNMSEFDFVSIWQTVDGDYPSLFWE